MTTTTIDAPAPARPRGALAILILLAIAALVFIGVAAAPYFSLNEARFGPYWPRRAGLLLHITAGIVAILSGPVQIWLGISDQRMQLHRGLGIVYVGAVLVGSAAGYYLAVTTTFGFLFGSGLFMLATAWLLTTGLAFLAIKRSLYDQHKEWMLRSYVVTFAFVLFRVTLPVAQQAGLEPGVAAVFSAWTCWAVPLLVAEAVIQGRKILAVQ